MSTVRLVIKSADLVEVTIDNKTFASFRGEDAKEDAIACCNSLVKPIRQSQDSWIEKYLTNRHPSTLR